MTAGIPAKTPTQENRMVDVKLKAQFVELCETNIENTMNTPGRNLRSIKFLNDNSWWS